MHLHLECPGEVLPSIVQLVAEHLHRQPLQQGGHHTVGLGWLAGRLVGWLWLALVGFGQIKYFIGVVCGADGAGLVFEDSYAKQCLVGKSKRCPGLLLSRHIIYVHQLPDVGYHTQIY